jgi:hypothetical protein
VDDELDGLLGFLSGRGVREVCSQCGSTSLEWMDRVGALDAGLDLSKAEDFIGAPVEKVWHCTACGERGFFGPVCGFGADDAEG